MHEQFKESMDLGGIGGGGDNTIILTHEPKPSPSLKLAAIVLEIGCLLSMYVFGAATFLFLGLGDFSLLDNNLFGGFLDAFGMELTGADFLAGLVAALNAGIMYACWAALLGGLPRSLNPRAARVLPLFLTVGFCMAVITELVFASSMMQGQATNPIGPAGGSRSPGLVLFAALLFAMVNMGAGLCGALAFPMKEREQYS